MSIREKPILIRKLKNYLTFLKDYGFSEIPSETLDSLQFQATTEKFSNPTIDTDPTYKMMTKKKSYYKY